MSSVKLRPFCPGTGELRVSYEIYFDYFGVYFNCLIMAMHCNLKSVFSREIFANSFPVCTLMYIFLSMPKQISVNQDLWILSHHIHEVYHC